MAMSSGYEHIYASTREGQVVRFKREDASLETRFDLVPEGDILFLIHHPTRDILACIDQKFGIKLFKP
jgi:hypothetical protein